MLSSLVSAQPCFILLLVLEKQLQELETALLASILDMEDYRQGCSASSFSSPLKWADGVLLVRSCPPPLDQHLLGLLGCSAVRPLTPHLLLEAPPSKPQFDPFRRNPAREARRSSNLPVSSSSSFQPGEAFGNRGDGDHLGAL